MSPAREAARPAAAEASGVRHPAPSAAPAPRAPADTPARPTDPAAPAGRSEGAGRAGEGRFLARTALVTGALTAAGALLGLVRDQTLAHLFGADGATDAFLVAWTVPEFASTLLIEDGMALVLVPAFSAALVHRTRGGSAGADPVRALVRTTLPRLALALAVVAVVAVVAAPLVVDLLAPGLPDPDLAVDCTRLTATCLLSFGLCGYCGAALRAHGRFYVPATIYVAYNTGIITAMFVLGGRWGVRSAAVGVAVGGCLMVAVQAPALWRRLRGADSAPGAPGAAPGTAPGAARPATRARLAGGAGGALIASVLLFGACRQSQVLIERFLGSSLPAGAISHLNYAQKVAQMPMVLSLMVCTVTFPAVARALAGGDTDAARRRVERDLGLVSAVVLCGTAAIVATAAPLVELLFQRGAFTAEDTTATAGVMRVYALGLLGHALVGALVRSYFSARRPTWYPLLSMALGVGVTAVFGALAVGPFGVRGIATANAAGITLGAVLLLCGTKRRAVPLRLDRVTRQLARAAAAAGCATGAGVLCAARVERARTTALGDGLHGALCTVLATSLTVLVVFLLVLRALGGLPGRGHDGRNEPAGPDRAPDRTPERAPTTAPATPTGSVDGPGPGRAPGAPHRSPDRKGIDAR
ncbi:murein biosynthesis integral membrane protein MurJ [Streptomyces sp. NPDC002454]